MLKTFRYADLSAEKIEFLTTRNADQLHSIGDRVNEIIGQVKLNGDTALRAYNQQFNQVTSSKLHLDAGEIEVIASKIGRQEQRALEIAFSNIHKFHALQTKRERKIETMPGVKCWRELRPIEKVGLYIPGGTAVLPSTLLMLGVPARIAGCKEIVVCTPPQKDGLINPYIAYCLYMLKIENVYLTGGAQAIAAMAYGTETVPRVSKIFGPGNQYVTKAKTILQTETQVAIDMPAGPSEVLIIADESSNPEFVAADLLAQAEHGADSQSILVTNHEGLIELVNLELEKQLPELPRADIARKALSNSYAIITDNSHEAMAFSNQYAPEHLIILTQDFELLSRKVVNAGSVFLGAMSPESVGDYASGTNHTLPTSGYAKSYSGVSVDSFVKKITFQHLSEEGLQQIGPIVEILAEIEQLEAHKRAVSIRIQSLIDKN